MSQYISISVSAIACILTSTCFNKCISHHIILVSVCCHTCRCHHYVLFSLHFNFVAVSVIPSFLFSMKFSYMYQSIVTHILASMNLLNICLVSYKTQIYFSIISTYLNISEMHNYVCIYSVCFIILLCLVSVCFHTCLSRY